MATPSTNFQRGRAYFHALSKTQTEGTQNVFESLYKSAHSQRASDIWAETVPYAADSSAADNNVVALPSVIKKYTQMSLTAIPGSNQQAWYLDSGTDFVRPWIAPTDVPQIATNAPSYGYQAILYDSSNNIIPPTEGIWEIDYYAGVIVFQEGYTPVDQGYGTPKVTCYVYIGQNLETGIVKRVYFTDKESVSVFSVTAPPVVQIWVTRTETKPFLFNKYLFNQAIENQASESYYAEITNTLSYNQATNLLTVSLSSPETGILCYIT
jgi:hypothetical protein